MKVESNVRKAVRMGVFVLVRNGGRIRIKAACCELSCSLLRGLASRISRWRKRELRKDGILQTCSQIRQKKQVWEGKRGMMRANQKPPTTCSTWRRSGSCIRLVWENTKGGHKGMGTKRKSQAFKKKLLTARIMNGNEETFDNYISGKRQTKEFITSWAGRKG